jgi:hypothetical protein
MAGLGRATEIKFERTRATVGEVHEGSAVEVDGRDEWGLMFSGSALEPDEVRHVADKVLRVMMKTALARAASYSDDLGEITLSGRDLGLLIRSAWLDGLQLGEIHARMDT